MSINGLLPCPFCGVRMIRCGLDRLHWQQWWEHEDRETSKCPFRNQTISDSSEIYKSAWNTRAPAISCNYCTSSDRETCAAKEEKGADCTCSCHRGSPSANTVERAREIVAEYKQRIPQLPSEGIVPCEKWLTTRLQIEFDRISAALAEKDAEIERLREALKGMVTNFSEFPCDDTERWREEHEAYENALIVLAPYL